jgi:SpoU rRNA methylase family enzyme
MSKYRFLSLVLLGGFFCVVQAASKGEPSAIGQVVAGGVRMDGIAAPSGTTIFSPSSLRTGAEPASVRLVTGELLHLGGNSTALFESVGAGQVRVEVDAGTLSYNQATGIMSTAASPASVSFPQRRTGSEVPTLDPPEGVQVVLTQPAHKGDTVLFVSDASRLNPDARLMVRTQDGQVHELHYIKSIDGNRIILTKPLEFDFSVNDIVLQGCQCDVVAGAPADGVVALLTQPALKGERTLSFNAIGMIDPDGTIMVKRRDGSIQEIHHIESISGNTITFKEKLKFPFQPGDVLIQGCHVPPYMALGWWTWKRAFLIGSLAGGGGVAPPIIIIDQNPSREECSKCMELYGAR